MTIDWDTLAHDALQGTTPSRETALALLRVPNEETLRLIDCAWRVRRASFDNRVKINVLLNAKSGYCPEDCGYCSQSRHAMTPIERYPIVPPETMLASARRAYDAGAQRFCIVAALRGPSWQQIEQVASAARMIKDEIPIELCACLGLIDDPAKAVALKDAGIDAYNHNLNTSEARYDSITSTHTYAERLRTMRVVRGAGLSPCSGVILGMGESDDEVVDLAFALRAEGAESIPVNFLIPIEGTPLGDGATVGGLTPWGCLRALCLFRFVNPVAEIRVSAGREIHLRSLQPLALLVANSLFLGDYLTEEGRAAEEDWSMLEDLGLQPEDVPVDAATLGVAASNVSD
jgi:biotin synthase